MSHHITQCDKTTHTTYNAPLDSPTPQHKTCPAQQPHPSPLTTVLPVVVGRYQKPADVAGGPVDEGGVEVDDSGSADHLVHDALANAAAALGTSYDLRQHSVYVLTGPEGEGRGGGEGRRKM